MPARGAFIAIDWGTTNRRAWRVAASGAAEDAIEDDRGVLSLDRGAYPGEIAALRARLGDLPVLAAGMVGSTRGWCDVPYVSPPATIATLAAATLDAGDGVAIVPGIALARDGRADVMRGEEVQALGAVHAGLVPADALVCQPGTHNKWIAIANGAIVDFTTAMTGELFALLRGQGILSGMLDGAVADGPAFRDGVRRGMGACDLLTALFEVRAAVLLGIRPAGEAAAFASGLLIGADVGARGGIAGRQVHLLASGALATLYAAAIDVAGGHAVAVASHAAFLAAIHAIREHRS